MVLSYLFVKLFTLPYEVKCRFFFSQIFYTRACTLTHVLNLAYRACEVFTTPAHRIYKERWVHINILTRSQLVFCCGAALIWIKLKFLNFFQLLYICNVYIRGRRGWERCITGCRAKRKDHLQINPAICYNLF